VPIVEPPGPLFCARHGEPGVRVRRVRRPHASLQPVCAECSADRALRLTAGAALCLAALLPVAALVATAPVAGVVGFGPTLVTGLLGVALFGGGLALLASGSWRALGGRPG
jgi:hypothetical protein